jgi:hypothetical protein
MVWVSLPGTMVTAMRELSFKTKERATVCSRLLWVPDMKATGNVISAKAKVSCGLTSLTNMKAAGSMDSPMERVL